MPSPDVTQPLTFVPIFMERVWGGRKLETVYSKALPPEKRIGESWEIVDRPEAQSVVRSGPFRGRTLHELWTEHRSEIFGDIPHSPRFPLLVKILDAAEKLSIQVHPPLEIAGELGGETKTEFWYIADAEPQAELYVGLRRGSGRAEFEHALQNGTVAEHVQRIAVKTGNAMFLPSGRVHAIGGGNLIVEIQQNSDTTYRVFDWNRLGTDGRPRQLHIAESLRCINFDDCQPALTKPRDETLVSHSLFDVQKWNLESEREVAPPNSFAIIFCLSGGIECAGIASKPGEFFLVPSSPRDRILKPLRSGTALLRVTVPRK